MPLGGVFRSVDDSQILPAATFDAWLGESLRPSVDDVVRLDDYAFAAGGGELLPPGDGLFDRILIVHLDRDRLGRSEGRGIGVAETTQHLEVPGVVPQGEGLALAGEDLERRQLQVVERSVGQQYRP